MPALPLQVLGVALLGAASLAAHIVWRNTLPREGATDVLACAVAAATVWLLSMTAWGDDLLWYGPAVVTATVLTAALALVSVLIPRS